MKFAHKHEAIAELARRYTTIFGFFWRQRKDLRCNFFNKDEAEFLPAGLSLLARPESASMLLTARVLMALVLCVLVWAVLGRIDIVVNATGKIIPSSRTKTIASVDIASVKALHVVEGQEVHAGDVLIELDASASDAEHDKATDAAAQSGLQVARSIALIEAVTYSRPPSVLSSSFGNRAQRDAANRQLDSQYRDFKAKLERLEDEIERHASALPIATQRAEDFKTLLPDRTVSHHAWLEREQVRLDVAGQLLEARNQRGALIAETIKQAHDAATEGSRSKSSSEQDSRRAAEHSRLLKLLAPVDGTVQQLTVHTVGGVVPAAQALMQIVPKEDVVEVEAFIENKDIGFIHDGQNAHAKIDAFDYTKYGTIDAAVKHVSHDAIQDEKRGLLYATKVALRKNSILVDEKRLPLIAGMSVNVEIKTGTRRVIEYVFSPLIRHARESLNER